MLVSSSGVKLFRICARKMDVTGFGMLRWQRIRILLVFLILPIIVADVSAARRFLTGGRQVLYIYRNHFLQLLPILLVLLFFHMMLRILLPEQFLDRFEFF